MSNFKSVDSVRNHITEKMLNTVLQDLKVCSGFFDFESLYSRVNEYLYSLYGIDPSDDTILTELGSLKVKTLNDVKPNDII